MALEHLTNKIHALRAQASYVREEYGQFAQNVRNDRRLTEDGKREQIAPALRHANASITALQEQETQAIEAKLREVQSSLFGSTDSSHDVIRERDAQDRADNIKDEDEALRVIERSLLNGDHSLANAVVRRSIEAGWPNAINLAGDKMPDAREKVNDIVALKQALNDTGQIISRAFAYGSVTG